MSVLPLVAMTDRKRPTNGRPIDADQTGATKIGPRIAGAADPVRRGAPDRREPAIDPRVVLAHREAARIVLTDAAHRPEAEIVLPAGAHHREVAKIDRTVAPDRRQAEIVPRAAADHREAVRIVLTDAADQQGAEIGHRVVADPREAGIDLPVAAGHRAGTIARRAAVDHQGAATVRRVAADLRGGEAGEARLLHGVEDRAVTEFATACRRATDVARRSAAPA